MINFLKKSLGVEIVNFVSCLKTKGKFIIKEGFTKSAFTQARKKLKADAFKDLSKTIVDQFYNEDEFEVKKWCGFRLLAVDGSQIVLPKTKELYERFGSPSNHLGEAKNQVKGRSSVLYDVLNNYVLDSVLGPLKSGERNLAITHLAYAEKSDLIIYDRGYPSITFIQEHIIREIDFLIRVKIDFNSIIKNFAKSKSSSKVVIFKDRDRKEKQVKVRLIKVILPSSEQEILITSLIDKKEYPSRIFKELYFKRWGVETFYDELKNKLKLEHFSGYSYNSIMQDFYIAMFVSNLQTLVVGDLEETVNETAVKKYKYKVNTSLSYGFLKNRIVGLFFSSKNVDLIINELRELFKRHLVPIRPNRSFVRAKEKYHRRAKPKIFKNYKDVF